MRRARCKQDTYMRLLGSPLLGLSRANSTRALLSPSPIHVRHRSDNFLRFGSPAETLVHVPMHVARLNDRASTDLTKQCYQLEELLHSQQLPVGKASHLESRKREMLNTIKSVVVPINSFEQVARSRLAFCITPTEVADSERIRVDIMRRVRSEVRVGEREELGEGASKSKENFRQCTERIKGFSSSQLEEARSHTSFPACSNPLAPSFFDAVKASSHSQVRLLLSQDLSLVHTTDSVGQTALHWAAKRNDVPMARVLKAAGADLNAMDMTLRTPLYIAARKDWSAMVGFLMEAGADRSLTSLSGSSPLDVVKLGSVSWSLIKRRSNNVAVSVFLGAMQHKTKRPTLPSSLFRAF